MPARRRRPTLAQIALANGILLGMLAVCVNFVAEACWFTMLLAYVPQHLYSVPSLIILIVAVVARRWRLALGQAVILAAVPLLVMGFTLPFGRDSGGERLRVMSFNIQYGRQGLHKVIADIAAARPAVFCLQECNTPEIAASIARAFRDYQIFHTGSMLIGSRLPVVASRRVPLQPHPKQLPLLEAVVVWNGRQIRIANVHLVPVFIDRYLTEDPAVIPGHLRVVAAIHDLQIRQIADYVRGDSRPVILCGDFNSPAIGLDYGKMGETFQDAFASSGVGFGYTIPARFPLVRVDRIYTTPGLAAVSCWVSPRVSSDHRAVIAEIVIPSTPQPLGG